MSNVTTSNLRGNLKQTGMGAMASQIQQVVQANTTNIIVFLWVETTGEWWMFTVINDP